MDDIRQMNLPDAEESTEEEVTQEQFQEQIQEMEEKQEINEALANIPDVFEINGQKIEIQSKTPRELVKIDKLILKLVKISYERETMSFEDADSEFWEKIESVSERYFDANCDVLVHVINKDPENPEITKEWILDNMDFSQNGVAEQVMDAYNRRCSPDNFFQKVIRSRKF
tara:strand:- start:613 stop:1125 length:513 start_codon:yes stop_codon:yes gene_type:complete